MLCESYNELGSAIGTGNVNNGGKFTRVGYGKPLMADNAGHSRATEHPPRPFLLSGV